METIKYLTKEKFIELENELNELKTVKRKEVAQSLEYARSLGDLSENAEYQEARELQAITEDRIAFIENALKTAKIVEEKHGDTVTLGSLIVVKKDSGEAQNFKVVGSDEANMSEGKISNQSPLGSAFIGKKAGDSVKIQTPKGSVKYTIVEVK